MKLTKNLFIFAAGISAVIFCGAKKPQTPAVEATVTPPAQTSTLSLSATEIELRDMLLGDTKTFTVETDGLWTVSSDAPWLTVSPTGGSGTTEVSVFANINGSEAERTCRLTVRTATRSVACTVRQAKTSPECFHGSSDVINLSDRGGHRMFRFTSGSEWTLTASDDWIVVDRLSGVGSQLLKISARDENVSGRERKGSITFTSDSKTKTFEVVQGYAGNYWNDGDVIALCKHKKGKGVPVVIVGDGFDREDLKKGGTWEKTGNGIPVYRDPAGKGGWWEKWGSFMAQRFMESEVVRDMLDYFDVFVLVSESQERGFVPKPDKKLKVNGEIVNYPAVSNKYKNADRNERFWDGIYADAKAGVKKEYAKMRAQGLKTHSDEEIDGNSRPVRVMFMTNGWYPGNASNPICRGGLHEPDFDYWAVHEFTGHVLTDMPDLYGNHVEKPSEKKLAELTKAHEEGFYWFADWRPDLAEGVAPEADQVIWKEFIGKPGYKKELEGAPYYNKANEVGVYKTSIQTNFYNYMWRPGETTAMHQWTLAFDLGSRYHMWNKIHQRAGDPEKKYNNLAKFKAYDAKRTKIDARLASPTGAKPSGLTPTNYDSWGIKTQDGVKDRFWRALWPADNWDKM
ncbi:MAG: BACON domain-containing protein [Rikenellaceae bacterium]|jgi:hypothetical protein|nr:BACON domain-containing protein [Rikenellaceae bacterium]